MQRTKSYFAKNGNERENKKFFCKKNFGTFRSFFVLLQVYGHFLPQKGLFFGHFWGFFGPNLTQKNNAFFSVHFYRTEINAENKTFFCTERKWTQWTNRSVVLNKNERFDHFLRSFPFIFEFLAIFEPLLTPKRPFFWSFLGTFGPGPTEMNGTFISVHF